ncbi:MAG: hypothetical protein F6K38_02600 [Moorea sp. SIO3B2]|uniref:hypothetical protein n=1 Tax=Moorena sp. SIO4E2 TaxID=2607826 RepID=UPI00031728B7|nr:hypothetical protein [Moorena sp. SIO4E2]NEP30417.1 hypothetical protein [Moorena sp. SIO3B2]
MKTAIVGTFNLQPSNLLTFNIKPSTLNLQPSTFNLLTFAFRPRYANNLLTFNSSRPFTD